MCMGGGPVGPQKYSGGSSGGSSSESGMSDAHKDMNTPEYHDKLRSDADKRRTTGSREAAEGRKGQKSLLGSIKSMF
tara:strand:- start:252 stop:482 length:231 start_codon:yes stop_codon:yes gene_type:complete